MTSTSIQKGDGQSHAQRIDVPDRMRRTGIARVTGRWHGKGPPLQVHRQVSVIQG